MNDFFARQLIIALEAVNEYRNKERSLNSLICRLEGVGQAVGGDFWNEKLFEITLELESINSELIDKQRALKDGEKEKIEMILSNLVDFINNLIYQLKDQDAAN